MKGKGRGVPLRAPGYTRRDRTRAHSAMSRLRGETIPPRGVATADNNREVEIPRESTIFGPEGNLRLCDSGLAKVCGVRNKISISKCSLLRKEVVIPRRDDSFVTAHFY